MPAVSVPKPLPGNGEGDPRSREEGSGEEESAWGQLAFQCGMKYWCTWGAKVAKRLCLLAISHYEVGLKKLWGRSSRPRGCLFLLQFLSASCCFSSLLSFWLPWIYSPFPFFMDYRNGVLLQLIECIESTQNEVKRKMIISKSFIEAPKSPD
jgi:hypothetical protein